MDKKQWLKQRLVFLKEHKLTEAQLEVLAGAYESFCKQRSVLQSLSHNLIRGKESTKQNLLKRGLAVRGYEMALVEREKLTVQVYKLVESVPHIKDVLEAANTCSWSEQLFRFLGDDEIRISARGRAVVAAYYALKGEDHPIPDGMFPLKASALLTKGSANCSES